MAHAWATNEAKFALNTHYVRLSASQRGAWRVVVGGWCVWGAVTPSSGAEKAVSWGRASMQEVTATQAQVATVGLAAAIAGYCAAGIQRHFAANEAGPVRSSVRSVAASGSGAGVYESERAVHEYLQFHFDRTILRGPAATPGAPSEALGFAQRVANVCLQHSRPELRRTALDVGCAVGGSCFELSKQFDRVVGIDFSHAFIDACVELQKKGEKAYTCMVSGEIQQQCVAEVPPGSQRTRCSFAQGDACDLKSCSLVTGHTFDCVLAANLLCRLPSPAKFLQEQAALVTSGGLLVLVSPYSWLPEYTPRSEWLGGTVDDATGNPWKSSEAVEAVLRGGFQLEERRQMPFLIREHERKFAWAVSECTVWRRK
eukprot:COSAG02_NODE_9056_length_2346_cov_6.077437_1_plen_371_part_00